MARGYHDWLVPETQGSLRSYIVPNTAGYSDPNGLGNLAILNPAGSGLIVRVQRMFAVSYMLSATIAPQTISLYVYRVASLGSGGALVTPLPMDTSDAGALTQARRNLTTNPTLGVQFFSFSYTIVARSAAGSDLIGDGGQLKTFYEHFSDGRRQPITLRDAEGLAIVQLGGGFDVQTACFIELTEETIG